MLKYNKILFNEKGFTLLELLIVIAIIGVLAATIFVSLNSSREKSHRSSALASLRSAMPVLIECGNSGGFGFNDSTSMAGMYVCQNTSSGNNLKIGYPAVWPTLLNGWSYNVPTGGDTGTSDYVYSASKAGQPTITCTVLTAQCI